jgi:hypothetical protein
VSLSLIAPGWLGRESRDHSYNSTLLAFMLQQPGFRSGHQPIASAPLQFANLAGPRLQHPIVLIGAHERCSRIRERMREGWVVLRLDYLPVTSGPTACVAGIRPVYYDGATIAFGPGRGP